MCGVLDAYRGTRVAVLGATGFIGGRVARLLARQRANLMLLVRDEQAARALLPHEAADVEIATVDVTDLDDVCAALARFSPVITFNLAGYGVVSTERDGDESAAFRINADLPQALCETSRTPSPGWPGQQVVHAGSVLERTSMATASPPETTRAADVMSLYGRSKLAGTERLSSRARRDGVAAITARLFQIYGPGEPEDRLLPYLMDRAGSTGPIAVSAGDQRKDFTYVDDVAEGLLRLGLVSAARPGETLDLGTGVLTTVRAFIDEAVRQLGIDPARLRAGSVTVRASERELPPIDLSRLRTLTGWVPGVTVAEGIARTLRTASSVPDSHD